MPGFLRQATASQARAIGPFLDDTDFKTAETGLTIANTDIKLVVNGGASANKNSGGGTHRVNGVYGVTFDATDTATVGEMEVSVVVSGALPVFDKFFVLEEAVYDALFAASAPGYVANAPVNVAQFGGSNGTFSSGRPEVNVTHAAGTAWGSGAITAASLASDAITAAKLASDVTTELQNGLATASALTTVGSNVADIQSRIPTALVSGRMASDMIAISGDTTAADNLETAFDDTAGAVPWQGIVDQGTAQAATSTTLQLRSGATFADDNILGAVIEITGGSAGVGQSRVITDYVGSTDTATVEAWATTPTGTITYKIWAAPPPDATAAAIKAVTDKLDDTLEDDGGTYRFTVNALEQAPAGGGGGSTDWTSDERTAIRAILGIPGSGTTPADPSTGILDTIRDSVATRASQTSVDDLPTNAELATALGTADDAVLAAIAALNNLSSAQAQTAAAAALTAYDPPTRAEATSDKAEILTAVGDVPTNSELATALAAADDAVLAAIAALNNLSAAGVRTAVGLASGNLDTQLSGMLTTALTESYRANGATGSVAQLLYEIAAHLGESSIAGTTKTTKRINHSTTAMTFTLDDADAPTEITRAT